MTAAKEMEIIARLPDCDGQAADAVPACIQVKMKDAQIYGYFFHDINDPNLDRPLKIQWFFLNEICADTHLRDSWERQFEEVLLEFEWEKVPN